MNYVTLLSSRATTLNLSDNYLEMAYNRHKQYSDIPMHGGKFREIYRKCRYDPALYNHLLLTIICSILTCSTLSQCEAMFTKLHGLVYDDWKAVNSQLVYITDALLPNLNQNAENNLLFIIDRLISFHATGLEGIICNLMKHFNPTIIRLLKNPLLLLCYPRILPHLAALFLSLEEADFASQLISRQITEPHGSPMVTTIPTNSGQIIFIPNIKNFYHHLLPTTLQETILFILREPVWIRQKTYYRWIEETYIHKHDQVMIRFLLKSCSDSPLPGTVKRWMMVLHIVERSPSHSNLMALFQDWLFDLSSSDANVLDPAITIMIYSSNKRIQLFEAILRFLVKTLKSITDKERSRARRNLRTGMALLVETKRYIPDSSYFHHFMSENSQRLYKRLFERTKDRMSISDQ